MKHISIKKIFTLCHTILFTLPLVFLAQNSTNYVNPFIGTGGHGHTFPGAVLPFGMVQLSPDTRIDGSWDGCSGYHYSDSIIYGFSHTHLSGTGVSDWGDVLLMPFINTPNIQTKTYKSGFSHQNEFASPGYYKVLLSKENIIAELTTTPRVGIHKYTFPKNAENKGLVIDLIHRDELLDYEIKAIDSVTLIGKRISKAWAKEQHVYFAMKLNSSYKIKFLVNGEYKTALNKNEKANGALLNFKNLKNNSLLVKLALSFVDEEGAIKNLKAEATDWNFEKYKQSAEKIWDKQLEKILVTSKDQNQLSIFYTALYHCFIHPSLNHDADYRLRAPNNEIYTDSTFTNYSVFSLWDTYRALHPLFTLIEQKRTSNFIKTFINYYDKTGRYPMWELSSNETDCMIGFHAASVVADAMIKGIRDFDSVLALDGAIASASYTAFGLPQFSKNGFLQVDDESESVSKSLEYSYDYWCVSRIASLVNRNNEAGEYLKKSLAYKNLFDAETGFMRPRKNGGWLSPFYPNEINNHFTEGNSWQYSFYVPQDIDGLINLYGGKINFEKKLDELFNTSQKLKGREQADVTGLIGQYAHGNEPSHHMAFLYNYVGAPEKSTAIVHKILNSFYKNTPDGLIGNEDCGQMSAWYIMASMGLYQVCPGTALYTITEPIFEQIKINFENNKTTTIVNKKELNQKISALLLNNKKSIRSAITHEQLIAGNEVKFLYTSISDSVSKFGKNILQMPHSRVDGVHAIPAPIIESKTELFKSETTFKIKPINGKVDKIIYNITPSDSFYSLYNFDKEIKISSTSTVSAIAISGKDSSIKIWAKLTKIKYPYEVAISGLCNPQYASYGKESLFDGIYGDLDWRKGNWLGYQGQDVTIEIDLLKQQEIKFVALNFLQDSRSWILLPKEVEILTSTDKKNYTLLSKQTHNITDRDEKKQTKNFFLCEIPIKTRYIKINIKNYGKLPDWHAGSGNEAFFFMDELEIK
ncbi:MAG: GH92 family glycosyl hydrolase [Bacteroidetes bacterium]|nr:GH92 family glycosyl hydrolase [Bacteroidota bacterium]